jgi:hypothetical protein
MLPENEDDEYFKFTFPCPYYGYRVDKLFESSKDKLLVKHLDHEDIKNLGFAAGKTNGMRYRYDYNGSIENRQGGYKVYSCTLIHDPSQQIVIIKMIIEGDGEKMFDGIVKNKSELAKILKQLHIL